MLPIIDQLSILVHLSKADNFVAQQESELIHSIGEKHGLSHDEIENIIDNPKPLKNLKDLPSDEKFDYLVTIIQLMKIDGKIFQKEIEFCERVALKLGYKPGVVADLSAYIYSDPTISTNKEFLRSLADQHLIRMVR
jgi:uncharacterized tellurite resistance protein B-like protein